MKLPPPHTHTSGAFLNDLRTPANTLTLATTFITLKHTRSNHPRLVFFISVLLLFNITSWEEKSHHSFEELVHELDGERHHVHLEKENNPCYKRKAPLFKKAPQGISSPQNAPSQRCLPQEVALC
uniref:Uncharacterized protein n=1 Tax=Oryzias sinensis TaxID=183150 RepID=A0A8C8DYI5_9TELE